MKISLLPFVLSDFKERTRRYSFLLTMLGMFFASYLIFTGKYTMRFGHLVGTLNSPWVGSFVAIYTTIIVVFFGFFIVKNNIALDRKTGVGQILAATPLSNTRYLVSKFCSNFMVLSLLMLFMMVAAVVMQLTGNAVNSLDLAALVLPFLHVTLPVVIFVAALAVLFQSAKWLSGIWGNIIYFIGMEFLLMLSVMLESQSVDLGSFYFITESMQQAALKHANLESLGFSIGFINMAPELGAKQLEYFSWEGISWNLELFLPRLQWIGLALVALIIARFAFGRFDPSNLKSAKKAKAKKVKAQKAGQKQQMVASKTAAISYSDLGPVKTGFSLISMILVELRLSLKSMHWSWHLIMLGLLALQTFLPSEYAIAYALPVAWIWPIAIWSSIGTRNKRFGTSHLLLSCPSPVGRQLVSAWISGVLIALAASSGIIVRFLLAGQLQQVLTLLIGALFVPTLASFLGALSSSRKLFEILYLGLWYMGPLNGLPQLDFIGVTGPGSWPLFLFLTLAMLPLTILIQKRFPAASSI